MKYGKRSGNNLNAMNFPSAVVLGLCPTGLAIIRALGRENIFVYVFDFDNFALGYFSKYSRRLAGKTLIRSESDLLKHLSLFGEKKEKKPVIFAASDYFLSFIARNNEKLSKLFRFSVINENRANLFLNKKEFYQICENSSVPFPKAFYPQSENDLKLINDIVIYPCIIKPIYTHIWAKYFKATKAIKIFSFQELINAYKKINNYGLSSNIMIQEIIPGPDNQIYFFASYFDANSSPQGIFTGRKIRQYPPEFGTTSAAESIYNEEIVSRSIRLLKLLNFQGLCDVEFKFDVRDNEFKIMEINPRPGRWYSLCEASGVNLIKIAYLDLIGIHNTKVYRQIDGVKWVFIYRDLLSAFSYIKSNTASFKSFVKMVVSKKVHAIFAYDDMFPAFLLPLTLFISLLAMIKKKCANLLRKSLA